jgi:tRNA (guanine37-N1)-methyltransferase
LPSTVIRQFFAASILKRAQDKHLVEVQVHDLREYAINKHKQVDDYALVVGQVWCS